MITVFQNRQLGRLDAELEEKKHGYRISEGENLQIHGRRWKLPFYSIHFFEYLLCSDFCLWPDLGIYPRVPGPDSEKRKHKQESHPHREK